MMFQSRNYTLKDLLDIPKLRTLLDTIDEIHRLPSAIIDSEGNILTATAWQDICTKFHRINPETEKKCKKSDSFIVQALAKNPPHVIYNCPFGLVDAATPIIVEGHHLGSVFTGQLFTQPPDEERFIRQARQYGFDEKDYLAAFRNVPIIAEERLHKNLKFLSRFTGMLATQGLVHLRQLAATKALQESEQRYQRLFDSILDGIFQADADGAFVRINRAGARIFGYATPEEIIGTNALERWRDPGDSDVYRKTLEQEKTVSAYPMKARKKNGESMEIEASSWIIEDERGTFLGIEGILREVTDRKRAEKAQRESEKVLSITLHSICDGVIATDSEGRLTLMNSAAERLTGWRITDARNMALSDVFHIVNAITRKTVENPVTRVLRNGAIAGLANHTVLISRDGTEYPIAGSAAPISDSDGLISGVILVFSDVTERYKAEDALRKSESFLKEAQMVAGLGTYEMDLATGLWKSSDILNDIFGIDETFVRSVAGWASLIHPDDQKMMVDYFTNEVVGKGHRFDKKYRIIRNNDGAERWLHGLGRLELNARKQPIRMIGTIQDITDEKAAETALAASEQKFRNLLESVQLVAVILDMNGNVTFCNDYFLSLTGWSRDDVINKNWFDLFIPEEARDAVKTMFRSAVAESSPPSHYENAILARNKTRKLIAWDDSLLRNAEGTIIGIASIGTDATEHRKLEGQLRQAQKMESIGRLAGGIAHDFNNILSVIIGYGHFVLMNMAKGDPQRTSIEQILEAGDRAAQLTKDLLLFSRKPLGEKRPVDLNESIRKVENFLKRIIGKDVECETTLLENPLTVLGAAHQLGQVLMNLATNARDAMPKGGLFTVAAEQTRLDETFISAHGYGKSGNYALITISDTGIGMDEATRGRLFEPFFTTKEVGKGTGLGLAVVYGIIKQHEGYVNVYSEPGRGTTFKIYLPLIEAGMHEEMKAPEENLTGGSETILLAEDDEKVRNLTRTVLERSGYKVITAYDGQDAVNKYKEHKDAIQLLLFASIMPKKTGKEAYGEIKATHPEIKIIFQSGYAPDAVRQMAQLDEKTAVVCKPISPTELLKLVRMTLDR